VTTKIMIAATDESTAIAFEVVPGQDHDGPHLEPLLDQVEKRLPHLDEVVADKAYAGSPQIDACLDRDLFPQVPNKSNAVDPRPYDKDAYKERNKVERLIGKAKQCRRIATRYDKLAKTFKAFLSLTFTIIAMKSS
jgi:transposase